MKKVGVFVVCALAGLVLSGCACSSCQKMSGRPRRTWTFPVPKQTQQVLLVTTLTSDGFRARMRAFEKVQGRWSPALEPMRAVVGRNGFSRDKREGDGKSPAGVFSFGTFFGSAEPPAGVKFPYRQVTANDFWVDDPNSPLYNTWQTGPVNGRWTSAESLLRNDQFYKYAVVINYNTSPVVAGRGSAIFLHIWDGPDKGRSGCVALAEEDLLKIMRWLDPAKKPVIVMGSEAMVKEF